MGFVRVSKPPRRAFRYLEGIQGNRATDAPDRPPLQQGVCIDLPLDLPLYVCKEPAAEESVEKTFSAVRTELYGMGFGRGGAILCPAEETGLTNRSC